MANTPRGGIHRLRFVMILTGILSLGVAGTPVAAEHTSADHGVLVVDKDGVECPHAEYDSIQAAVDAAARGSRIKVCPDLYNESVTVPKPLALEAFRSRSHAGRCHQESASDPDDPRRDVVVTGDSVAFDLRATGIVLDGFVIRDNVVGVDSEEASGYVIRRNLLQHNHSGVGPGGNEAVRSVVSHNCFRENTRTIPGPLGPVPGSGIVNLAPADNLLITHNAFVRNAFGIRLGGATGATISHNTSLLDGTWLRMGGTRRLTVQHNRIGRGPNEGMLFFSHGFTGAPNANALISHNVISGRGLDGFRAGVRPPALVDSVLAHNRISGNGRDGIRIERGGNTGNRIEHNRLTGNAEHDCHDETAGSGTAGTANFWSGNKAFTENRDGLCVDGG